MKAEIKQKGTPGKWVERPRRSELLVCSTCGGKYIKTRDKQKTCIRCWARVESLRNK